MPKGITYSFTDRFGTVHSRFSADHTAQRYTYAVCRYWPGKDGAFASPGKSGVSYASRLGLAESTALRARQDHPALVDILPVTATPGRITAKD